mmetsp:Transcript_59539/g.69001  ORF Transcript_59539/g.69001 Transcript_59539/m.69001 type:complete len:508 (+) Transcript_59539:79-1602(+)|eukprot:CAMPEP_0176446996 /NCGR_PEP_ID=MMETSP0127-20121128/24716_1 /TAXON_ID=938130 /ORGANISM="Platyophrya macrostoma, Strain WH" /LENGTH=507 /DNA_ID=CAMNT_0017833253 /DNA_START=43 /DNA_END=1566 /DNA_ORIENTATION=+
MADVSVAVAEGLGYPRRLRVCVLCSSYEGSESELKAFDDLQQTPQWHVPENDPDMTFETVQIKKATSYRTIRALVKSGMYDVFYNQCDGAKDEDRAGEDVVHALEEFRVPFTASTSKYYELSKPDMKMLAHYAHIPTAAFAVIERSSEVRERCSSLQFPVIIKHICGYSSIGMTKDCKCYTMEELENRAERFIKEYQSALVEEFITGDEVTVLACADQTQPDGIRVFHPVMVKFPTGDDFKHFDLKWQAFDDMGWLRVPNDDPALQQMLNITRTSFREMMGGIGYGRCDLRIDRVNNRAIFLEINPNCGIMYPPGQESSADWILKLAPDMNHRDFALLQIREALARNVREALLYRVDYDTKRGYHLRAATKIPEGRVVFQDEGKYFRVVTRPYVEKHWSASDREAFALGAWPLGSDRHYYAIWDHDPKMWRSFNHSCEPNLAFDDARSLNVTALRDIEPNEELTMDFRTFSDDAMKPFTCHCNTSSCAGRIEPKQPRLSPIKFQRAL